MKKINLSSFLFLMTLCAFGQDEPIPFASFTEITVNTTFPEYRLLKTDGGFVEIEGGIKGILLYRVDANTFMAYERNCPYRPNEACATVDVDISRIFLIDRCCGSRFNLNDGYPSGGPASWPLRRYRTVVTGTTVTITDEIVN